MANFRLHPTIPPPPPPLLTSLYVGDLHPSVTELDLYTLFSNIVPVYNIHLFRHQVSLKSLCYAFIHFHSPFYAAYALCWLNHAQLRGNPIRLMWVQRDPVLRKSGIGNLFVKNFDSSVREADLEGTFGRFGNILSCKIARDDNGNSKGFGFVQFCSKESAADALSVLNGSFLYRKQITVEQFLKKSERKESKFLKKSERKEAQFTNVYVKNLDKDFTESALIEKFSTYGKITSAVIAKDGEGKSRGFGFVNFESHENAKKAIEALNGAEIGAKKWYVGKAMTKAERGPLLRKQKPAVSNLFVRNLATFVTKKDVKQLFSSFGVVTFAKLVYDKNGVSKGIAYICFSKPEEARRALKMTNGCFCNGRYLYVTLARPRDEHDRHLQILSALRSMYSACFAYRVPQLQMVKEKRVQKKDVRSCDGN